MRELEEVDDAILATTLVQGLPFQVFNHLGGISRAPVAAIHLFSALALNFLNLLCKTRLVFIVGVIIDRGIPYAAGVLNFRPDQGLVGELSRGMAVLKLNGRPLAQL